MKVGPAPFKKDLFSSGQSTTTTYITMALIPAPKAGSEAIEMVNESPLEEGSHEVVVHKVIDQLGVKKKKFQSEEFEIVDLCTIVFAQVGDDGQERYAATSGMRISGSPKSALYQIIEGITGQPPVTGSDTQSLVGIPCLVTVKRVTSATGKVYHLVDTAMPQPRKAKAAAAPARTAPKPTTPRPASKPKAAPVAPAAEEEDESDPFA